MSLSPNKVAFFIPPELKDFKLKLFNRIGASIEKAGGRIIRGDHRLLETLPLDVTPIVGCSPQLSEMISNWRESGRSWLYWDRGYCRRVFATWLPKGEGGGYYRWHHNAYQLRKMRDVPDDRWKSMRTEMLPWRKSGKHIVIAAPTRTYARFHKCESWIADTIDMLARNTDRQLVIRDKESKRSLQADLDGAHALVTHGSIAAVESVILGCPVFVHSDSAAALVGRTDLTKIETPAYPDRDQWVHSLAYSQFNERELVDGTLWKLLT